VTYVPEHIERYAEEHSTPPAELFARLAAETRATQEEPQMMVGALEGAFLAFVVRLKRPRRVLEIGTFTGWSSITMAQALPPDGSIVTCDVNEETSAIARRYAAEAGVEDRIEYRIGPALVTLASLSGPFDLAFLDARKDQYAHYYEAVLPLLAEDGVMLADNTLFGMHEGHPLEEFNRRVRDDPRVECLLLPIREGVTMIRRRGRSGPTVAASG
jgi:predicted O-methyltransferase YrrM